MSSQEKASKKLSIGMPVYNGEAYVREAIDSLLSQSFVDFELIISDNASTDSTPIICQEYAVRDPRVRYIRQVENLGAAGNLKFVLKAARHEYFMWAACDDSWSENWVETLLAAIGSGDAGVFGGYREGDGALVHPPTYLKDQQIRFFLDSDLTGKCLHAYGIFRRDIMLQSDLAYLDCPVGCDQVYLLQLLQWGGFRCVPGGTLYYRVHGGSVSSQQSRARGRWRNLVSRYPFAYYQLAFQAVPCRLKIVMWLMIVVKFLKEQTAMVLPVLLALLKRATRLFPV